MRFHFEDTIEKFGPPPNDKTKYHFWFTRTFTYFSYWFATLYVIIEGWNKLELSDVKIDALLDSNYVKLLRRFRNGVFHYQKNYFDKRVKDYFNEGYSVLEWAADLHNEFSGYFLKWYESRGIKYSIQELDNGRIHVLIKQDDNEQEQ